MIVNGISEYWWSSRKTCLKLLGPNANYSSLPKAIPEAFIKLRPWVHQGWEMVLIAAELIHPRSPLVSSGQKLSSNQYKLLCNNALKSRNWTPKQLQISLEIVRREAIAIDKRNWFAKHQAFPGVVQRINQLSDEGFEFAVLTTKGAEFTAELLNYFKLKPQLLYGRESGSKKNVLLELSKIRLLKGFIEDRRSTLETIINTPGLSSLPCYLASWGYLKDQDKKDLPCNIHLLNTKTFMTPLASWP